MCETECVVAVSASEPIGGPVCLYLGADVRMSDGDAVGSRVGESERLCDGCSDGLSDQSNRRAERPHACLCPLSSGVIAGVLVL